MKGRERTKKAERWESETERRRERKNTRTQRKESEGGTKNGASETETQRDRDPQHLCSSPIHSQDHITYALVRTTVKHALSKRLQIQHSKNLHDC